MSDISPARTNDRSLLGRERSSWHPWAGAKNSFPPQCHRSSISHRGLSPVVAHVCTPGAIPVQSCYVDLVAFSGVSKEKKRTFFPSPFPDKQTVKLLFPFLLLRPFHPALPNETLFCLLLLLRPWLLLTARVGCGRGERRKREKSCPKKCYLSPFFPFPVPPAPTLRRGGGKEGGLDRRVERKESGEKPTS